MYSEEEISYGLGRLSITVSSKTRDSCIKRLKSTYLFLREQIFSGASAKELTPVLQSFDFSKENDTLKNLNSGARRYGRLCQYDPLIVEVINKNEGLYYLPLILQSGANPNSFVFGGDYNCMHLCVMSARKVDLIEVLLDGGADPMIPTKGEEGGVLPIFIGLRARRAQFLHVLKQDKRIQKYLNSLEFLKDLKREMIIQDESDSTYSYTFNLQEFLSLQAFISQMLDDSCPITLTQNTCTKRGTCNSLVDFLLRTGLNNDSVTVNSLLTGESDEISEDSSNKCVWNEEMNLLRELVVCGARMSESSRLIQFLQVISEVWKRCACYEAISNQGTLCSICEKYVESAKSLVLAVYRSGCLQNPSMVTKQMQKIPALDVLLDDEILNYRPPFSLSHMCRVVIRERLCEVNSGRPICDNVFNLKMPKIISAYLLLDL